MGTCFLYGNGSRSDLNFTLVGGGTRPENPKENTIWVQTGTAITLWHFRAEANPSWSAPDGVVFITSSTVPTNTYINAIKKNQVAIYLQLLGCIQCNGGVWRKLNAYVYTGGTWVQFSATFAATINVTYPAGSTCSATDGTTTLTAPDTGGSWACVVPNTGTWTVTCTDGTSTATMSVSITEDGQSKTTSLTYVGLPTFTYTGSYQTIDDGNNNWRIKFKTSGTLTFSKLQGAGSGIDIFCVGGGGGGDASGGCGGRTTTVKAKTVTAGTSYAVTVGAGGAAGGGAGGKSSFGSLASAAGGGGPGGTGGSGGGGSGLYLASGNKHNGGNGGSNGANGVNGYGTDGFRNGTGQGTTTREFGESSGTLYAGGGGGAGDYDCTSGSGGSGGGGAGGDLWDSAPRAGGAGTTNLGGGGGGGSTGGAGGSGIVIIRNKR